MPREATRRGHIRGYFNLAVAPAGATAAEEFLTDLVPGFRFVVEKVTAIVQVVGAGAGATRTFRVIKGASTVVASKAIALAEVGTKGLAIDIPVTAANADFGDLDTLTVDVAAGGTAYTALTLQFAIKYRQVEQQIG